MVNNTEVVFIIKIQKWWRKKLASKKKCFNCSKNILEVNYLIKNWRIKKKNKQHQYDVAKNVVICCNCIIKDFSFNCNHGLYCYHKSIILPNLFDKKPILELNKTKKENMKAITENDYNYIVYVSEIVEKYLVKKYPDVLELINKKFEHVSLFEYNYFDIKINIPFEIFIDSRIHCKLPSKPLKNLYHTNNFGEFKYNFKANPCYLNFIGNFIRGHYTFSHFRWRHNDWYNPNY